METDDNEFRNSSSPRTIVDTEKDSEYGEIDYSFNQKSTPTSVISPDKNVDFEVNEKDDYTIQQNYTAQTNYDLKQKTRYFAPNNEEQDFDEDDFSVIEVQPKQEVQPKEEVHVGARLKIVLTSFLVIMSSLIFATIWNFVSISKLNESIAEKENEVKELQLSINTLNSEYDLLGSEDIIKSLAFESGYVATGESNCVTIALDDMYEEKKPPKISSNWFNDVCNFITSLFH